MINSVTLPKGQCYVEYVFGAIELVSMLAGERQFSPICGLF